MRSSMRFRSTRITVCRLPVTSRAQALANLLIFMKEVIAHWTGGVNSKSSITAASSVWGIL
jgi:hypothetical protein